MAYVTFRPVARSSVRPALWPTLHAAVEIAAIVGAFGFVLAMVVGAF